ncbi:IS110 family transposase, partial [Macrococcus canis]|nr:IS110 family transposase [Macrococcus canis]
MITIEYFGIDVGKGKSFIAHYSNNDFVKEFELIHNGNGFNSLLSYINNYAGIYFLFEATGIYSKVIERFCKENHVPYYMINPL